MIAIHLMPFAFRGEQAPDLWIFHTALSRLGAKAAYILSADYLTSDGNTSELSALEKRSLIQSSYYLIPDKEMRAFAETYPTREVAMRVYLTEEVPHLIEIYRRALVQLTASGTVQAVITSCRCPSLVRACRDRSIHVIYQEIASLRSPYYSPTIYLDISGSAKPTEAEARYLKLSSERQTLPVYSRSELLDILCSRKIDRKTEFKCGVALQVEDDENIVAYANGLNSTGLINKALESADFAEILVRDHPAAHFAYRPRHRTEPARDESTSVGEFLGRIDHLYTINSGIAIEALLHGISVTCLGDSPFRFLTSQPPNSDELAKRLSFYCLNYLVPEEFFLDEEYINWRIGSPSELDIQKRHIRAHALQAKPQKSFAQISVDIGKGFSEQASIKRFTKPGKQRLVFNGFPQGGKTRALRLDTDHDHAAVRIERVTLQSSGGAETSVSAFSPDAEYVDASGLYFLKRCTSTVIEVPTERAAPLRQVTVDVEVITRESAEVRSEFGGRRVEAMGMRQIFAQRDQATAERDKIAAERQLVALERDRAVADLMQMSAQREQAVAQRDQVASERNALATTVHLLKRTLSWRITSPLRWAGSKLLGRSLQLGLGSLIPEPWFEEQSQPSPDAHAAPPGASGEGLKLVRQFVEAAVDDARDPYPEAFDVLSGKEAGLPAATLERDSAKIVAFYLPQYHRVEENSEWWGPGFTEWTNVVKGKPNYDGHFQPHLPRELGFYDLSNIEVMREQTSLAKQYGVSAFCFYYYWFSGRRILERPLEDFLKSDIDFNYCLCWANENWTRTWDGDTRSVLMEQKYTDSDPELFIQSLLPYFRDRRYIRVAGKPMLVVYRAKEIPDVKTVFAAWRASAKAAGFSGLYINVVDFYDVSHPDEIDADALTEFPPHKFNGVGSNPDAAPVITNPDFQGSIVDYAKVITQSLGRSKPDFTLYRAAMPSWDNTARRQNTPTIVHGANPALFGEWLRYLRAYTREHLTRDTENFIFVNAWNEWGEGCHLEPDQKTGLGYLDAVAKSGWFDPAAALDTVRDRALHAAENSVAARQLEVRKP